MAKRPAVRPTDDRRVDPANRFAVPLTLRQRNRVKVLLRAGAGDADVDIADDLGVTTDTAADVRRRVGRGRGATPGRAADDRRDPDGRPLGAVGEAAVGRHSAAVDARLRLGPPAHPHGRRAAAVTARAGNRRTPAGPGFGRGYFFSFLAASSFAFSRSWRANLRSHMISYQSFDVRAGGGFSPFGRSRIAIATSHRDFSAPNSW